MEMIVTYQKKKKEMTVGAGNTIRISCKWFELSFFKCQSIEVMSMYTSNFLFIWILNIKWDRQIKEFRSLHWHVVVLIDQSLVRPIAAFGFGNWFIIC